jgi:hypothetical protein
MSKKQESNKRWRLENKEHIKTYNKRYFEENRETLLANRENDRERIQRQITCECGSIYIYSNQARHLRTKKHQDYINVSKEN